MLLPTESFVVKTSEKMSHKIRLKKDHLRASLGSPLSPGHARGSESFLPDTA